MAIPHHQLEGAFSFAPVLENRGGMELGDGRAEEVASVDEAQGLGRWVETAEVPVGPPGMRPTVV